LLSVVRQETRSKVCSTKQRSSPISFVRPGKEQGRRRRQAAVAEERARRRQLAEGKGRVLPRGAFRFVVVRGDEPVEEQDGERRDTDAPAAQRRRGRWRWRQWRERKGEGVPQLQSCEHRVILSEMTLSHGYIWSSIHKSVQKHGFSFCPS
jgi:hypothetical protein